MVRKQILLTKKQDNWLRRKCKESGLSQAEEIRRMFDRAIQKDNIIQSTKAVKG